MLIVHVCSCLFSASNHYSDHDNSIELLISLPIRLILTGLQYLEVGTDFIGLAGPACWRTNVFTARCYIERSIHIRKVVPPSVCLSVTLRYRNHIGRNTSKIISGLVSLGVHSLQTQRHGSTPKGTPRNFVK